MPKSATRLHLEQILGGKETGEKEANRMIRVLCVFSAIETVLLARAGEEREMIAEEIERIRYAQQRGELIVDLAEKRLSFADLKTAWSNITRAVNEYERNLAAPEPRRQTLV